MEPAAGALGRKSERQADLQLVHCIVFLVRRKPVTRRSEVLMGRASRARQRGEEMLKRIAVALPPTSLAAFDLLAVMKVSHVVRSSQDEKEKFDEDASLEVEGASVEESWKAAAISVCRLNTWNGGEARATRRNLLGHVFMFWIVRICFEIIWEFFFPEIRVRLTILFTLVERRLDEGTRWPKGCLQPGSTQEGTVKPGRTREFIEGRVEPGGTTEGIH